MSEENTSTTRSQDTYDSATNDFLSKWNQERKDRYEAAFSTKDKILAALKAAGVEFVVVDYQGSGDSGDFTNPYVKDANPGLDYASYDDYKKAKEAMDKRNSVLTDNRITLPETTSTFCEKTKTWVEKTEDVEVTLSKAVGDLTYELLEYSHPGWEINDGSSGSFLIDVEKGKISLEHTNYYTQSEQFDTEF